MAKTHKQARDWRRGSKRRIIAEIAERGSSKREAYNELRPMVVAQTLVFEANVNGHREPKPIHEQYQELKNEIGRVYKILGRAARADFDSPEEEPEFIGEEEEQEEQEQEEIEEEEEQEEEIRLHSRGKERVKSELAKFLQRVREIRAFCEERARLSEPLDFISMRPAQAAASLIPSGIPASALLAAMVMHWPSDAKREAGIEEFDFVKLSREIMEDREIDPNEEIAEGYGKPHKLFGYCLVLAENRQPIFLVGPHGTGKSHIARQLAAYLDVDYSETPMTSGATRGDLLGRFTASPERPFIEARFDEIYGSGGVFNFEEIDAADPALLIVLNNSLASDTFYNSNSGEIVEKHEDFIAVSTANTFGLGATREYVARERLDAATIDRWRMGRVWIDLDESVEETILYTLR